MNRPARQSISGMSIQQKVPLLISGLLAGVIALYAWASWSAVQEASLEVARQRLLSLTDQLSQLFNQSAMNEAIATRTLASDSAVRAFAVSSGRLSKAAALESLRKSGPRPELTIRAEILDALGASMLGLPGVQPERHEEIVVTLAKASAAEGFSAVGRLQLINDTLVLPAAAAIMDGNRPIGFVVRWRRVASTEQARDQLSSLVGGNAAVYLGNDLGDVWTDFVAPVAKPPAGVNLRAGEIREYTRPHGGPVIATIHATADAPWVVLVEFSRQAVMAPATTFLRRALLLGLLFIAAGTTLAWALSRSITRPLTELTVAAAHLAGGDYSTVVASDRADELGDLSRAFNAMIEHVEAAQRGLEEKVRNRTELLRERNEELETFGHSISHDLRAPLRAMHGFSQALLEDFGPQLGDVGKEYAQRVVAAAVRMDALIQDLLTYSRVGRTELELASVSLSEVVSDALEQLEADVTASGASIEVNADLPRVLAHRVTLTQAVANLIGNSLKFVPLGCRPAVRITAENSNGLTRLWVEDNGIGIDEVHHERIFGVFERLHQSERYPGTGIGLAIVRKSVERMGGHVGLAAAHADGSRFWIELRSAGGAS